MICTSYFNRSINGIDITPKREKENHDGYHHCFTQHSIIITIQQSTTNSVGIWKNLSLKSDAAVNMSVVWPVSQKSNYECAHETSEDGWWWFFLSLVFHGCYWRWASISVSCHPNIPVDSFLFGNISSWSAAKYHWDDWSSSFHLLSFFGDFWSLLNSQTNQTLMCVHNHHTCACALIIIIIMMDDDDGLQLWCWLDRTGPDDVIHPHVIIETSTVGVVMEDGDYVLSGIGLECEPRCESLGSIVGVLEVSVKSPWRRGSISWLVRLSSEPLGQGWRRMALRQKQQKAADKAQRALKSDYMWQGIDRIPARGEG